MYVGIFMYKVPSLCCITRRLRATFIGASLFLWWSPTRSSISALGMFCGLNDAEKCSNVRRNLAVQPFNVICLQESKSVDVSLTKAVSFLPGGFSYTVKGSAGASGGIVTAGEIPLFIASMKLL